jgi:hypothetical protein
MGIIVVNPEGFKEVSKYSGNPFLDAMTDLQEVFTSLTTYQKAKPFIDRYSDTSLSDLKDKIKAHLPEVVNEDGSINFTKIEELASKGNKIAETVLEIKNHREGFANASVGEKLATLIDPEKSKIMAPILSGEHIIKNARVMKRLQRVEDTIKRAGLPKEWEAMLLLNKEKIAENPEFLSAFLNYFTLLPKENNKQNLTLEQQQQSTQEDNYNFFRPQIKSMQDMFNEKTPRLKINNNNTTQVSNSDTNQVIQKILPEVQKFAKTKKLDKKSNKKSNSPIPSILGNVKSLPSYPPVLYSSNQIQGSPKWNNDIISQILNPRLLFSKE